ncbi:hypothetical protein DITRI_Ditri13aG0056000 [Diplodiscus trichospermus]
MRNKKGYHIVQPTANEERFSNYYCKYLFWVAVGYYLWKKILSITGYRFHPTDFELLHFYLHNKNLGRDSLVKVIAEVEDICGLEPWELPEHSNIHSGDQVWYFFYRPNYKYRNSTRIKRTTNEGYWKPTGNPRKIMARDLETVIGKKRTLVFYKGHVSDNNKNKTGWIMHEYELTAATPNQRKLGKGEISCIEEGQSSHYLPSSLGKYIANNANPAEAARCLTDQFDPNEMLAQIEAFNNPEGIEHQPTELLNTFLAGDFPMNESSTWTSDFGNQEAQNAVPNYQLPTEVPIEHELPQHQSGTNEQSELGNLVPADERSNQQNLVTENDGSTISMPSNSKNALAQNSGPLDLSNVPAKTTDELFDELEPLPVLNCPVQGNGLGQLFDECISWISADPFKELEIPNASGNQSSTNEEESPTAAIGGCSLSFAGMMESSHAINPSRKRSRTDYEGFGRYM